MDKTHRIFLLYIRLAIKTVVCSWIKIEKNLADKEVINEIKKDEKISNILSDKNLLKHIIVKNRLVNFIVKWKKYF